eukprot:TRINITY_DN9320_c0_g3_i2.p1 TRINITY_DN9320_c0_g3~~TRINITY_DN9320_c0_g3_i2.p1  ORF type:complete len:513 (-),score=96.24 TRINITY_DN9320_c0_g3_i2:264-1802(-)
MASACDYDNYDNPLVARYASKEMSQLWSPQRKFSTWRRLWIALAEAEKELGLDITDEQIEELRANVDNINFAEAEAQERIVRHDVMAHIHAYGLQCPRAKGIIHLGATSCYVGDNTDLMQLRDGCGLIGRQLSRTIAALREFCLEHKALPTLGFTHMQPAQLVTVGKRAALWLQDLCMDAADLRAVRAGLPFLGVKGTTGTQASFMELFGGDETKVIALEERVMRRMGFTSLLTVSGQTYTRKIDEQVLAVLSRIAQSAHKAATDMRLLMHLREVEEPFGAQQIGSSAMAYKRNPMRSERVCSLARFVISLHANTAHTHANQWMERTLDDSANRRLTLPQAFLAVDALLALLANVMRGAHVWPHVIRARIMHELPFMATENILMAAVKAGGDRQLLHEAIRAHSMQAAHRVKQDGAPNDLLDRIRADPLFASIAHTLDDILDPALYIGRCPQQVDHLVSVVVDPLLQKLAQDDLDLPLYCLQPTRTGALASDTAADAAAAPITSSPEDVVRV